MHRIYLAFLCFFRILFGRPLPAEVIALPPRGLEAPEPPRLPAKSAVVEEKPKQKEEKPRPVEKKKVDITPGALQLL